MAVDTLKLYERLVKANIAPEASREIAEAISDNASAKDDISRLEKIMVTKEDVVLLEIRLIKWMIGIGIGGFTALLGLLKLIKVL